MLSLTQVGIICNLLDFNNESLTHNLFPVKIMTINTTSEIKWAITILLRKNKICVTILKVKFWHRVSCYTKCDFTVTLEYERKIWLDFFFIKDTLNL